MGPLDPTFTDRVRETTVLLGGVMLLGLLGLGQPTAAASFTVGLGLAVLLWKSARILVAYLDHEHWRARDVALCLLLYVGKYAAAAVGIWSLVRLGWMRPVVFTAGFVLPTVVVALKAVALGALPPGADPAPVYSRYRKVDGVG